MSWDRIIEQQYEPPQVCNKIHVSFSEGRYKKNSFKKNDKKNINKKKCDNK